MIISYGKHAGKPLSQIAEEDPMYLCFLLSSRANSFGYVHHLRKYINEYLSHMIVIPVGAHKGKLFDEIKRKDPVYALWLNWTIDGFQYLT